LETANVTLGSDFCRMHPDAAPGDYVMLAVTDTGVGMSAEVKGRLFEPFFTTKEIGRGTGLGLAVVYGIVRQSDGHILVESEPGSGARIEVYLPKAEATESEQAEPPRARPVGGTETILLAEDEDVVRESAARILRSGGYTVLEAEGGQTALNLCRQREETIHLLLTDVLMPHMNGDELARRVREVLPGIRVLYTSGYTDNIIDPKNALAQGEFLQKPFNMSTLLQKVREVLDK